MNIGRLLSVSYITAMLTVIIGACLKIMHYGGADIILGVGVITFIFFLVLAIYEVNTNDRFTRLEKIFWTMALLLFSSVTGLLYLLASRTKIAGRRTAI